MKKLIITFCLLCMSAVVLPAKPTADTLSNEPDQLPERTRYFKEKYIETYNAPFEKVWTSIKETLQGMGANVASQKYSQTEDGFYKGTIRSDAWVFTEGKDSTYRILQKYSYDMIAIPGSIWTNGRLEFKIKVEEIATDSVQIIMTTKMSAMETHVTEIVHFWQSNGLLEKKFLEDLKAKIESNQSNG